LKKKKLWAPTERHVKKKRLTEAKEHTAVIDKAMAKYRAKIEEFD
jgi:hypothetical protein